MAWLTATERGLGTVASMNAFPSPAISAARLELREFGPDDAGLVHELLAAGQPEALAAAARWALTEGGVQRAWLTANTDNVASVRVAEKAGFHREGTLRRTGLEDDGLHDQALFSLLDDEL